jgi:tetratricopeptide (TPR) repeat protein
VDAPAALSNLAGLYHRQGRLTEAEGLYRRALDAVEKKLDPSHPDVATSLSNLAVILQDQGRYAESGPLLLRALVIGEKTLGAAHPSLANILGNLASQRNAQGHYAEAERRYRSVIEIRETALGLQHPDTALAYNNLAAFYKELGRSSDAEPLLRRARAVFEAALGPEHHLSILTVGNLSTVLHDLRRHDEAEELYKKAAELREKVLGPRHPDVGLSLNNLGSYYSERERYQEAEPVLKRALNILEATYQPDHPLIATALNNLGALYVGQKRYAEAEAAVKRMLAMREKTLGAEHPNTAAGLDALAGVSRERKRWPEAYRLSKRATGILLRRESREMMTTHRPEGGSGRGEIRSNRYIFTGHVRAALHVAERTPARAAALVDEAFQLAQRAHLSDAAAALSQMAARFKKGEGELALLVRRRQDLVWRYDALDGQLVKTASKPAAARDAAGEQSWRTELVRLDQAIRDADLTLKGSFPDYAALANPEPLSIRAAQGHLLRDEALYQVMVGRDESVAWVVTRDAVRARILPIGEKALDEDVAALRCGLDPSIWDPTEDAQLLARRRNCERLLGNEPARGPGPPFDLERAHRLYQKLFAPFESLIGGKHLLVVPYGSLTTLPMHVLVTAPPERVATGMARYAKAAWLAKRQALTVLPSVSSLKTLRGAGLRSQAANPFLAFANPLLLGSAGDNREAWAKQVCPSGPLAGTPQAARPPAPRAPWRTCCRAGLSTWR